MYEESEFRKIVHARVESYRLSADKAAELLGRILRSLSADGQGRKG